MKMKYIIPLKNSIAIKKMQKTYKVKKAHKDMKTGVKKNM